jgi:hypothetical protein
MAKGFGGISVKPPNFKSNDSISPLLKLKQQILQIDDDSSCVCGSNKTYLQCCGQLHNVIQTLSEFNPESITRARYSAYALGVADFILKTTHESNKVSED